MLDFGGQRMCWRRNPTEKTVEDKHQSATPDQINIQLWLADGLMFIH